MHRQELEEKELASVMHQFTDGQIDILLSTTIIESGLDIPNANTLIVDRADTFGLAQLYQLRGRVGRAASRAYAYFFRHRKKTPTIEGQERVLIPGDPEREIEALRLREGIHLVEPIQNDLFTLAERFGISFEKM